MSPGKAGAALPRLLLALALAFVAVEVGLRLVPRAWFPPLRLLDRVYTAGSAWSEMMQGDPVVGYRLKPGVALRFPSEGGAVDFRTTGLPSDDFGYRDIGTEPPFPLLAIGGSFSVCDDVSGEACWVRRLAESTGVSAGTLGVNGYSTLAAARMLERYGARFAPRVVLLEVYPNDLRDNIVFESWERSGSDDMWAWLRESRGRTAVRRWLGSYSMVFRLLEGASRGYQRNLVKYKDDRLDLILRFDSWMVRIIREGEEHPGWEPTKRSLREAREIATRQGATLVPVLFPTKEQAYVALLGESEPADVVRNLDRSLDMLVELCRSEGMFCCDLRRPLREAASAGRQVYHRISAHMNEDGNAISAAAVERCLRAGGHLDGLE